MKVEPLQQHSNQDGDKNVVLNIFVYGTLMFEDIVRSLTDVQLRTAQATLHDYRRCKIQDPTRDARGPTIIFEKGSVVEGKVLLGADQRIIEILDLFELAAGGYERVQGFVTLQDTTQISVEFYRATDEVREFLTKEDWSESEFRDNSLSFYIEERIPSLRRKWKAMGLFPETQVKNT